MILGAAVETMHQGLTILSILNRKRGGFVCAPGIMRWTMHMAVRFVTGASGVIALEGLADGFGE